MFANEIRELSSEEIKQKIEESSQELLNLRFQKATGQLKDYTRFKLVRRDIARLKTVLQEKTRS